MPGACFNDKFKIIIVFTEFCDKIKIGMKITDYKKILETAFEYAARGAVILLVVLLFFGRINPARISKDISASTPLLKSAFYFKSFTSGVVTATGQKAKDEKSSGLSLSDGADYDDYYASIASMIAAAGELGEGGGESQSEAAENIHAKKYSVVWQSFKSAHPEVASALEYARLASIITFVAVLICVLGVFFVCGTNKVRRIGQIIVLAGSALVCLSMINFGVAHSRFALASDALAQNAISPRGIPIFVVLSVIAFAMTMYFVVTEKTDSSAQSSFSERPFQVALRVISLLIFILLFIPGVNPARISTNISRNVSLFTSGFSYGTYTQNMQRLLVRGFLPYSYVNLAFASSLLACLGAIACGVGACMSVGNNRLKRYAHFTLFGGSAVLFLSMFGLQRAYSLFAASPNVDKLDVIEPSGSIWFIVLSLAIFCFTLVSFVKTPVPEKDEKCKIEAPFQLFLMLLPFLILVFIFSYLPLWGWRYAFFDYQAGEALNMDRWAGFKWFKMPFNNAATRADILRVLRNTLAMSGLGILTSWCPMVFAVFLAEIKNSKARRVIQTLTTVPNFISWVLVYAIAFCIFGTEGFISSLMVNGGFWSQGKNMLMGDSFIWLKMLMWGMWKGLGWSAIMYIAAISGIDQQLYEAATVDGAGRFQKIWHITLPELIPTYIVLLILSISNILSNGMDQYLVFKNPTNKGPIEVLDLYVYQLTFEAGSSSNIPFSTVVSMFKSLVSVVLLFVTNRISKIVRGSSIF